MSVISCRDCQRHRRHIEALRDRLGELELRLEGALQRERRTASTRTKDDFRSLDIGSRADGSTPVA